jgi:ABC-2 type transport system permease protein
MNLSIAIAKPLSFLKRDFLAAVSYRLNFIMQLGGIFISTLTFFFLSRLIGSGVSNQLQSYGGDYFSFALIGVAFADYLTVSLSSFAGEIRSAQLMGTLEALLVTPTSVPAILFSSSLYDFAFTSLRVLMYLVFGVFLFHMKLQVTSIAAFLIVTILTMLVFIGIGLFSAAFIIVFKQGSPLNWIMGTASGLLGGILYPVSVLPAWLQPFSFLLPITYALEAIRQVLLKGATIADVSHQILMLVLFAVLLLPVGVMAFGYGLKVAKREGSLIYY